MKFFKKILILCLVVSLLAFGTFFALSVYRVTEFMSEVGDNSGVQDDSCSDRNIDYLLQKYYIIVNETLPRSEVLDSWCIKPAMSSDFFGLIFISKTASVSEDRFAAEDTWQSSIIREAYQLFDAYLPPQSAPRSAYSGFADG